MAFIIMCHPPGSCYLGEKITIDICTPDLYQLFVSLFYLIFFLILTFYKKYWVFNKYFCVDQIFPYIIFQEYV